MDSPRSKPPRLAEAFLRWYCFDEILETILGDLYELHEKRTKASGKWYADLCFILEVFDLCRPFAWKKRNRILFNHRVMIRHNIKIAWRHTIKHKTYTLINIFGLTLGLSSFLLILFFLNHERSFDRFHHNQERVYRINFAFQDNSGNVTTLVNSPPALAPGIRGQFSELAKISRLRYAMNCLFSNGDIHFYEDHGYYADSIFLDLLPFDLLSGDPQTALDQPNSVVITRDLALKYFNDPDPVGKTLLFNHTTTLKITGVLANLPDNSHLNFDFLVSFPTYTVPEGYASDLTSWSWLGFLTYIELKPNSDPKHFEAELAQYFRDLNPEDPSPMQPIVQNLTDIYLGSAGMVDDVASHVRFGSRLSVNVLLLVALLILLIAGFNFSNLTHALSIHRRRATGVKKVLGAQRKGIVIQLLTESLLLVFFCLILSIGIIYFVFPTISRFMHWDFDLGFSEIVKVIPVLLAAGIVLGVVSGLYPALNLSKLKIINSLKGTLKGERQNPFQFKHVLVTLQFAISIGLICTAVIMVRQIRFMTHAETGYHAENVVLIKMLPEEMSRFFGVYKEELVRNSAVRSVSRSERVVGEPWPFSVIRKVGEGPEMNKMIFFNQADYDYFTTLGLSLEQGRVFSREHSRDTTQAVIINQQAVELLGLEEPIGQQVHFFDLEGPRTIVGVVKDFNYTSLHQEIGPAVMLLPFIDLEYMYVRFNPGNLKNQITLLENTWQQVAEGIPLEWKFLDADLERMYRSEEKLSHMIQAFSILAILLACLGIYGMITFMINNRIKEVGIRKILGASLFSLYALFVKTYIYKSMLAMLMIVPLIHYVLTGWLNHFAYRVQILWWLYPAATLLLVMMILSTVSLQILKATKQNPTGLLRHE